MQAGILISLADKIRILLDLTCTLMLAPVRNGQQLSLVTAGYQFLGGQNPNCLYRVRTFFVFFDTTAVVSDTGYRT